MKRILTVILLLLAGAGCYEPAMEVECAEGAPLAAEAVMEGLIDCRVIEQPGPRLECFEAIIDLAVQESQ